MEETFKEAMIFTVNIVFDSYIRKCQQKSELVDKLLVRLDSVLDKSLEDDKPDFACGDALEKIKQVLDDTATQMEYAKQIIVAKSLAWQEYPDDENARCAFISGYLSAGGFH